MQTYAEKLIKSLNLLQHPEGGHFRRHYQSALQITTNQPRSAMTAIYYLLAGNDISQFHRLDADESWHYYQGNTTLIVHMIDLDGQYHQCKLDGKNQFHLIVPAGFWFGAELIDKAPKHYTLVGCTVAPGFEFSGFELADSEQLISTYPQHKEVILSLT